MHQLWKYFMHLSLINLLYFSKRWIRFDVLGLYSCADLGANLFLKFQQDEMIGSLSQKYRLAKLHNKT